MNTDKPKAEVKETRIAAKCLFAAFQVLLQAQPWQREWHF